MKERLRAARTEISSRFPLPESFWQQWIADEIISAERCVTQLHGSSFLVTSQLTCPGPCWSWLWHWSHTQGNALFVFSIPCPPASAEDVAAIEALYERAIKDYLSVPLWLEYIEVCDSIHERLAFQSHACSAG